MSLPLTATDDCGSQLTIWWAHDTNRVRVKLCTPRVGLEEGYWAEVHLLPADARQLARHLADAAIAAEQYERGER